MIALLVIPLAHAGHWINAFLYLSPVLIIAGLLVFQARRDKGKDDEDEDWDDEEDEDV